MGQEAANTAGGKRPHVCSSNLLACAAEITSSLGAFVPSSRASSAIGRSHCPEATEGAEQFSTPMAKQLLQQCSCLLCCWRCFAGRHTNDTWKSMKWFQPEKIRKDKHYTMYTYDARKPVTTDDTQLPPPWLDCELYVHTPSNFNTVFTVLLSCFPTLHEENLLSKPSAWDHSELNFALVKLLHHTRGSTVPEEFVSGCLGSGSFLNSSLLAISRCSMDADSALSISQWTGSRVHQFVPPSGPCPTPLLVLLLVASYQAMTYRENVVMMLATAWSKKTNGANAGCHPTSLHLD